MKKIQELLNKPKIRQVLIIIFVILLIAVTVYGIINERQYFRRRTIREIQQVTNSYGVWGPLFSGLLIFLNAAIPPVPLPGTILEMAAGYIFDFGLGFLVVWIAQMCAALADYALTRFFGGSLVSKLLNNRISRIYRGYLEKKGPMAIFILRATMSAPFNIMSFLAGLTQMNIFKFTVATGLGAIPESVLFTFFGTVVKHTRIRFWYIFILVIILGTIGPFLSYLTMKGMLQKEMKKK